MNPRLAWAVCLVLVLIGFFSFVFYLDRYPGPYFDDCVYNQPAVRAHDGLSFAWPMADAAPYGKTLWAYHSPFFPHMQVLTFRLLGVSTFACRIPQYVAAFLSILLLSGILIRFGCLWSAMLAAVFWLGDRSLVEVLYGRMDGIALLFLVGALGTFTKWLSTGSGPALFWTGLLTGTAVGFHPVVVMFVAGIGAAVLVLAPGGALRSLVSYVTGLAIPAAASLAFVAPHFREALQQFLWHGHLAKRADWVTNAWNLIVVLRWSRYWALALMAVTLFFLLPALASIGVRSRSTAWRPHALIVSSSIFALCGCVALFSISHLPYYLIYFSIWPVAALLVSLETNGLPEKFRKPALAALVLLVVAWLPSAAWNALRWREAHIFYPMLDAGVFVERVRAAVAPGAPFKVSPEYFILARPLGHELVYPPLAQAPELPSADWLVLSDTDLKRLGGAHAPGLSDRALVYSGPLYGSERISGVMTVLAPVGVPK